MRIGILGGYQEDFDRLPSPPKGVDLRLINRDRAHLRLGAGLDLVIVMSKFVSHKHWKTLRSFGVPTLVVQGGWSSLTKTIEQLANRQQERVDSNER